MTTIDQRILIPSPPDVVWGFISDIRNNPRWQADCTSVVFLTSKVSGPGTRWRQSMARGSEQVIEISAWYEGLGYQYTYIDGMPFRESSGRVRLQEIPEGTVVQWTINYEAGGLLGGVRNSLGLNRKLETMMVTSLKSLWKQISDSGSAKRQHEAKSLMREAPDAEARANYKPRHTPVVDIRADSEDRVPAPQTVPEPQAAAQLDSDAKFRPPAGYAIPEPPVADDDTKPRRPVEAAPIAEPPRMRGIADKLVQDTEEPEFLQDMARFAPPPEPEKVVDDTQPVKPLVAETTSTSESGAEPDIMDEFALDESDFAPPQTISAQPSEKSLTDEINALVYEPEAWDKPEDEPFPALRISVEKDTLPAEPGAQTPVDTPQHSVTDEINALIADVEADVTAEPSASRHSAEFTPVDVEAEPPDSPQPEAAAEPNEVASVGTPAPTAPEAHKIDESSFPLPSVTDTSKMSIWEIFGVPRPSETGEAAAADTPSEPAIQEAPAPSEAVTTAEAPPEPTADVAPPATKAVATETAKSTLLDDIPMPDMTTATGELVIVEVVREVSGPQRRTGLRARMRQSSTRLRKPV